MFLGQTWGSTGSCRPQMSPMLAGWTFAIREDLPPPDFVELFFDVNN